MALLEFSVSRGEIQANVGKHKQQGLVVVAYSDYYPSCDGIVANETLEELL